jgi:hypothetical protein
MVMKKNNNSVVEEKNLKENISSPAPTMRLRRRCYSLPPAKLDASPSIRKGLTMYRAEKSKSP